MDDLTAVSRARQLLTRLNIRSFPVDVLAIAADRGFKIHESNKLAKGEAGSTFVKNGSKIILLNSSDHPYRRRFTVLHEIAHHVLDLPSVHGEKLGSTELERYKGRPKEEVLCDIFAAECLVPWQLIQSLTDELDFTAATVRNLSDRFEASKPCVASRFAQTSRGLLAYVLAEEGVVRNVIPSKTLRERGVWINGVHLPHVSAAIRAARSEANTETADLDGSDWSSSDCASRFSCYEEAINLGVWGQTLSLLTFEEIAGSTTGAPTTSEEDELLPELTGYLPWPKK